MHGLISFIKKLKLIQRIRTVGSKTHKLRPGLTLVRITQNRVTIFVSYPLAMISHTLFGRHT